MRRLQSLRSSTSMAPKPARVRSRLYPSRLSTPAAAIHSLSRRRSPGERLGRATPGGRPVPPREPPPPPAAHPLIEPPALARREPRPRDPVGEGEPSSRNQDPRALGESPGLVGHGEGGFLPQAGGEARRPEGEAHGIASDEAHAGA